MPSRTLISIDPGASGGIAVRRRDGKVESFAMPEAEMALLARLEIIETALLSEAVGQSQSNWKPIVVIEQVGGFVGGNPAPGSAMFKFGEGYGFIRGIITAKLWPLYTMRPQAWQKALSLGTSKSYPSKPAWKRHLRDEASRRFPDQKVTLATADALLLLDAFAVTNPQLF